MNTRVGIFSNPLLVGFEQVERTLDRAAKTSGEGYPPYNIEQISDERLQITFAVAGFTEADLDVQIEDKQLVVRGRQQDDKSRIFLHRGIAARQFQKAFVLADGIQVTGAYLADGLLHVDLRQPPAEARVRNIPIRRGGAENPPRASQDGITEASSTSGVDTQTRIPMKFNRTGKGS